MLVAQCDAFIQFFAADAEIHTVFAELILQIGKNALFVRAVHVHLVDENKARHAVLLQKPPQGQRVALDAVGAADDQYRVIEHL